MSPGAPAHGQEQAGPPRAGVVSALHSDYSLQAPFQVRLLLSSNSRDVTGSQPVQVAGGLHSVCLLELPRGGTLEARCVCFPLREVTESQQPSGSPGLLFTVSWLKIRFCTGGKNSLKVQFVVFSTQCEIIMPWG